jgi:hypothetical protein
MGSRRAAESARRRPGYEGRPAFEFGKIRHKVSAITQFDMIADIFVNRNILFEFSDLIDPERFD